MREMAPPACGHANLFDPMVLSFTQLMLKFLFKKKKKMAAPPPDAPFLVPTIHSWEIPFLRSHYHLVLLTSLCHSISLLFEEKQMNMAAEEQNADLHMKALPRIADPSAPWYYPEIGLD